jgi:hypothetical protein
MVWHSGVQMYDIACAGMGAGIKMYGVVGVSGGGLEGEKTTSGLRAGRDAHDAARVLAPHGLGAVSERKVQRTASYSLVENEGRQLSNHSACQRKPLTQIFIFRT